jgi:small subunit ribosomal protein S3
MGQKVNPIGLRLGINRTWDSRWYANTGEYARLLHEDIRIRRALRTDKSLAKASVSRIVIERPHRKCRVTLYAGRPGMVIGPSGKNIDELRRKLGALVKDAEVHLNVLEIRKPETDALLVAQGIAQQLEGRVAFRRAMKKSMQSAIRMGAQGIRVNVSGRLGGAEIARMEWYREGRVPLHTLRADVDYGTYEAKTAYGIIGVKVWIFKGEVLEHDPMAQDRRAAEQGERPRGERVERDRERDNRPRGDRNDRNRRGPGRGPGRGASAVQNAEG